MKGFTRFFVKPRRPHRKTGMNKVEEKYAVFLEQQKMCGDLVDYFFEGITLRLADRTTYTPDFVVITNDYIELHEVKARWNRGKENEHTHWEDDARVKFKVALDRFWMFRFVVVYYDKQHGWQREYFS